MDMAGKGRIGQRPFHRNSVGQVPGHRPGRLERLAERFQPYAPGLQLQLQQRFTAGKVHGAVQDMGSLVQDDFHIVEPGLLVLPFHGPMGLLDSLAQQFSILEGEGPKSLGTF